MQAGGNGSVMKTDKMLANNQKNEFLRYSITSKCDEPNDWEITGQGNNFEILENTGIESLPEEEQFIKDFKMKVVHGEPRMTFFHLPQLQSH